MTEERMKQIIRQHYTATILNAKTARSNMDISLRALESNIQTIRDFGEAFEGAQFNLSTLGKAVDGDVAIFSFYVQLKKFLEGLLEYFDIPIPDINICEPKEEEGNAKSDGTDDR